MRILKLTICKTLHISALIILLLGFSIHSQSQALDVSSCAAIDKRSNGNGQAARAAGNFTGFGQNNPVAANVTGTIYQNVAFDPTVKTGNVNFKWNSATTITNLPVITRVWITASGAISGTLSAIKFGPPPPPVIVGQNYFVDYSYYGQNMPPAGKVTLEFADPQTGRPSFRCTFDMQSNGTATDPTIDCTPTITTQPSNLSICAASSATFTVAADGATSIQWQINNSGTWTNISNGGDYSGATAGTLTINNSTTYDGKSYRAILAGTGCQSATSNTVVLIAKAKPTAVFSGSTSICGTGTRSLGVNLTGAGPWSLTYTSTPSGGSASPATASNITTSPFYFSVSPSGTTTFALTAVSDAFCVNSSPAGSVSTTVTAEPTISPNNPVTCFGSSTASLTYTTSNSPDQYSLTTGVRAMTGFSTITNATLTGSPLTITIPSNSAAGIYDFNLVVRNSTTGCTSVIVPITITVAALPLVSASAGSGSVCVGSTATLTAAPSGLSTYSWKNQSNVVVGSAQSSLVTVNSNTTYTLTGTDANGCSNTANVIVTALAGPTLSVTPSAPTICNGNTTRLTASGGNTYSWADGGGGSSGLSATTGSSVVASPSVTTTYTITSQNTSGCQSTGNVTVTVNAPNIGVTSSATICSGGTKVLTATGGTSYTWYPSATLSASTGTSVTATPTATTTYFVVGTDANGCSATASSTVTISPSPVNIGTSTGQNLVFCTQGTTTFPLSVNVSSAVTSMTWAYSIAGTSYTSFSSAMTVSGVTLTPSSTGSTNVTLTLSGYGSSPYGGPRYLRVSIVGSTCTYNYDIYLTDTKGNGTTSAPTASKTTVCNSEATTVTVGSLAAGTTLQWESSANNSTWATISGATSASYTTGALTSSTYYRAVFNGGNGNCGQTTPSLLVTVVSAPAANTVTPSTSCTDGVNTVILTGSAISSTTYQWQSSTDNTNFSDILGAVNQNYSLPNTTVSATTNFRRVATTGSCTSSTSTSVAVYAPIASNQITNSVTSFCGTATATALTNTTPVGGNGTYVYQWKSSTDGTNFSNVPSGGTSQNYTTSVQTQNYWYQRVVTSGGCSSTSSSFKITVNTAPTITATSGTTQCSGVAKTLTGGGGVSYAWSPSTELSAVSGSSVIALPTSTRTYTVTGTDANGCTNTATSTITVTSTPADPTLTSLTKTICNNAGSFNMAVLINTGTGTEWFSAPEPSGTYAISSTTSSAGIYYVFSKTGSCYSVGSASLTLSVADVSTPAVAATTLSFCSPATADLTSLQSAANSGVALEWHTAASGPGAGNLVGSPSAAGTGTYYLYAHSTSGACYGSASSAVAVTINAVTNGSVSTTSASVCAPSTIDLNSYNNTSGSNNVYSWFNTNSPSPANLVSIPSSLSTAGTYYLYVVNAAGCRGSASPAFTATVNIKPTAGISSPASVCNGTASSITATSNASSPSYAWEVSTNSGTSWSSVTNAGVYSGSTTSGLAISNTTGLGGNYYRYTVTSAASCSTISNSAILVEEATPTVNTQPADLSITSGSAASFSITISGSPTADFQWNLSTDGTNFSNIADYNTYQGVNSSTLIIPSATNSFNNYKYKVAVSNSCTTNTSNAATLTFIAGPSATTNAASGVTPTSGVINGTVNDNGNVTAVSFDWGTTSDLTGSTNTAATTGGSISAGAGSTLTALTLGSLISGTTYYFRVKAVN
ncbi:MAG: hypothetical protein JWN76_191, partial [Chitinophagaceae bacterium]|nr:hypothetical protein [Chitinophagaceae bacterium]